MADAQTEIDLSQLHQAVLDAIRQEFPDLATVDDYPDSRTRVATPAVLVEIAEMEGVEDDPGTDQQALGLRFEARIIMGFRTPSVHREIRRFAGALASFVRLNRWGLPVEGARVIGAYPDEFDPELDQYEVWRLEWEQVAHFGATVWDGSGIPPGTVLVGVTPEIGVPHEDDYSDLTEGEGA